MRITVQTDYALRVLMYLAVEEGRVTIDAVADGYGISRNHVMKVVQRLSALGYVESRRGRTGGLKLARAPEDINVGGLVRQIEDIGQFVECFAPKTNRCVVTPACGLKSVLAGAVEQFLAHLDRFTVADLVLRPRMFSELLHAESVEVG